MPITGRAADQIIRDGMDEYWRAVYSPSDDGLSDIELKWKREHERDIARMEKKFGPALDAYFGKT